MADLELKHDNVENKKETEFDPRSIKVEGESAPESASEPVESTDRGLFDFMGKKDEKKVGHQEEAFATEFDQKVHVTQPEDHKEEAQEQKHKGLLHRSNSSSSSSSSEEEVEVDGKKIKKKKEKKGLKEKIKEKISGDKKEDVPVEKYQEPAAVHGGHVEGGDHEKKGFLDNIKDKLPGGHKKPEEVPPPPPTPAAPPAAAAEATIPDGEAKEKKGFLEKIKEKLPGYHHKTVEEKEKEKEAHNESH